MLVVKLCLSVGLMGDGRLVSLASRATYDPMDGETR